MYTLVKGVVNLPVQYQGLTFILTSRSSSSEFRKTETGAVDLPVEKLQIQIQGSKGRNSKSILYVWNYTYRFTWIPGRKRITIAVIE